MHVHVHMHMHMHMHMHACTCMGLQVHMHMHRLGRRGVARHVGVSHCCLQVWRRQQLLLVLGLRKGCRGAARDARVERRRQHAWLGLGLGWGLD